MGAKSRRKGRATPGAHRRIRFCRGCLPLCRRAHSDASVELTSAPLTPEGLLFQAARGSYNCSPMSRNLVRSNHRTADSGGSRNDRRVRVSSRPPRRRIRRRVFLCKRRRDLRIDEAVEFRSLSVRICPEKGPDGMAGVAVMKRF